MPSVLWSVTLHFIFHTFLHPIFLQHMPILSQPVFCCTTEIMSSNPSLSLNSLLRNSVFYLNITHPFDHSYLCPLKCHLIFRSSPQRWPNKPGKNVRTYVHPYVPPSVRTSTIKLNAATNQIVEFVRVDETFTTIWLSMSSKVRVKVMWDLKFQKWRFSKSISSTIFQPIKKIPTVSYTRPKYLKSFGPDFLISS